MRSDLLFVLLLVCPSLHAQFGFRADLEKPRENGFYQIAVSPELSAHAKIDLSDLRIMDGKNEVPYIIRTSQPVLPASGFIDCPILSQLHDSNKTILDLDVQKLQGTNRLSLVMGNTSVERLTALSGSADRKNWFIIEENILLHASGTNTEGSFVQSIDFPFVHYPFLKLVIRNEHNDPLNIQGAGVYQQMTAEKGPVFLSNPPLQFSQTDSNKHSYIFITQKEPYTTDRIIFSVGGAPFYQRRAHLFVASATDKKMEELATFILTSDIRPMVSIDPLKTERLLLDIENQDNPPLKIRTVQTEQVQKYLVAYLEKGKEYVLKTDNPLAYAPQYDLVQFRDRIPQNLPSIGFGQLLPESSTSLTPDRKYWLWIVLVSGILILGFFSFRLMKDVKEADG